MPWKHDGKTIVEGRSWTSSEGIVHPKNWSSAWSSDDKKSFGLTWEEPTTPKSYDSRFYWDADTAKSLTDVNEVDLDGKPILDTDGNQVVTLGLINTWLKIIRETAHEKLSHTDWYVVRVTEGQGTIPTPVKEYRQAVRASSNKIEGLISGVKTVDELIALFDVPTKDGVPTGNAPIADWPEEI